MKKVIAISLILTFSFALFGCAKGNEAPTTTAPYVDSGYNNDYNNNGYVDNNYNSSDANVTNTTTTEIPQTSTNQSGSNNQSGNGNVNNNSNNTEAVVPTQANTTEAPKGITPTSVETANGIVKATYSLSERTYIVYYMGELLTHNSRFPIISWANGTGCAPSLYDGLLRELASAGFIVIASDETMAADGTAQIAAIDFLIDENNNKDSDLYNKVNSSKIGVIGHSQGGRSAVNAGAADPRITCVLSLAGSSYTEEAAKLSKPVLFMAGTKDKIVDADRWLVTAYNSVTGPAVYASLNGAVHITCCSNPTAYSTYAISWFNAWFYNDVNSKSVFTSGGELSSDSNWSGFMSKGF